MKPEPTKKLMDRVADALEGIQAMLRVGNQRATFERFCADLQRLLEAYEGRKDDQISALEAREELKIKDKRTLDAHCEKLKLDTNDLHRADLPKIRTSMKNSASRPNAKKLAKKQKGKPR